MSRRVALVGLAVLAGSMGPAWAKEDYTVVCNGNQVLIRGLGYGSGSSSDCFVTTVRGEQADARSWVKRFFPGGRCSCDGNGRVSPK